MEWASGEEARVDHIDGYPGSMAARTDAWVRACAHRYHFWLCSRAKVPNRNPEYVVRGCDPDAELCIDRVEGGDDLGDFRSLKGVEGRAVDQAINRSAAADYGPDSIDVRV